MEGLWRPEPASAGMLLMDVEDPGLAETVSRRCPDTVVWNRYAGGPSAPTPCPPGAHRDGVVMRLPKGRDAQDMYLHMAATALRPGGSLWVFGYRREGAASFVRRETPPWMEPFVPWGSKARVRVARSRRTHAPVAPPFSLDAWRRRVVLHLPVGEGVDHTFSFFPGMFAEGQLDEASALLVSHLPPMPERPEVLDFGCGAGVLAFAARHLAPAARITLLDHDALALAAAAENVPGGRAVASEGWAELGADARFDLVVSNPPLHRREREDFSALEDLVGGAASRLRPGGRLVLVVQRTVGVAPLLREHFGAAVQLLAETTRFCVWSAARP
jgi:16S rRNA (guanine1207-N2)-methyltransferase